MAVRWSAEHHNGQHISACDRPRLLNAAVSGALRALMIRAFSRLAVVALAACAGPRLPPSIGFGIGGFGFTGCCSAIGSGVGFGVPVGGPTVAEASDQYVTSALITVPPEYQQHWSQYRLEVAAGGQRMALAAPAPTS